MANKDRAAARSHVAAEARAWRKKMRGEREAGRPAGNPPAAIHYVAFYLTWIVTTPEYSEIFVFLILPNTLM